MNPIGSILVAEDQVSARESLVELLKGEGYEVHDAPDGNAAVHARREVEVSRRKDLS